MKNTTKATYDELLDALKEVAVAFRDGGSHLERTAALVNADRVIERSQRVRRNQDDELAAIAYESADRDQYGSLD